MAIQHQQLLLMEVSTVIVYIAALAFPFVYLSVPEDLPAPSIMAINGTAIVIEWVEPIMPNGFIVLYTVLL